MTVAQMVDAEVAGSGWFEGYLEHVPSAFAVTSGARHTLVFANAAFRRLTSIGTTAPLGRPIGDAVHGHNPVALITLLDRVARSGRVLRDQHIDPVSEDALGWCCTMWPAMNRGGEPACLIEMRVATQTEHTLALQREVTERMLMSALRERDAAEVAEVSRRGAAFLAAEGRRLHNSLDEKATLDAMARMSLPRLGAWCVVDILDEDGTVRRLAIVHPDPAKQDLIGDLESRWPPGADDAFGVPAMLEHAETKLIAEGIDDALFRTSQDHDNLRILRALGVGPLLTVPLVIGERLAGAVTFVGGLGRPFTPQDVQLAEDLAARSAMALERARLYGEAIALRKQAESANAAKSAFLASMSHELRTPLNAIGGYVELMDMGLHGPVSEKQHADLARIKASQFHLAGLIEDLLNFTKLGSGQLAFDITDVMVQDALAASVAMVEPLISQKRLVCDGVERKNAFVARADLEKLNQVLVNLLSNAIKFTAPGGRISIDSASTEQTVLITISDTGIGISVDKQEAIFDPFVQVTSGLAGRDRGVGLGLAISRGLARGMHGDLTVESTLGKGSRFILTLPRAHNDDARSEVSRH